MNTIKTKYAEKVAALLVDAKEALSQYLDAKIATLTGDTIEKITKIRNAYDEALTKTTRKPNTDTDSWDNGYKCETQASVKAWLTAAVNKIGEAAA